MIVADPQSQEEFRATVPIRSRNSVWCRVRSGPETVGRNLGVGGRGDSGAEVRRMQMRLVMRRESSGAEHVVTK